VSDYVGVGWAQTRQRAAADPEEVGALALAAGLDVELPSIHGYGQVLADALERGRVPESLLDESAGRVLRDKFALGLFDDPYVPEDAVQIRSVASEGDELSQRLAVESFTLLKNENNLLPLSRDVRNVAVIGPFADSTIVGFPAYTYPAALPIIRARFTGEEIAMAGADPGSSDIPAAVAAARDADAVILYIGGHAAWAGKDRTEGEGTDSVNIDLPPQQVELVKAVTDVGKPTVVVSFGHGLSYTTFEDGPLKLERDNVDVGGELRASLTVKNAGKRRGTEIVQLYAADTATGVTFPAQQLIGFARLDLEPDASKTVAFIVPMSLLADTGITGELVVEPGPVEISAGSSSSDIRSTASINVTGKTRVIRGEERAFLSDANVSS
jgi:hypothetical protein